MSNVQSWWRKGVDSLGLAYRIVAGSFSLLVRYPKLLVPMLPVFALVVLVLLGTSLSIEQSPWLVVLQVYGAALALMISFGVISRMLIQIHEGREPSLKAAALSPGLVRMIPGIAALTALWLGVVLVVVIVEVIIRTILEALLRDLGERLGDTVVSAIFGTFADALRMAAFMMVAIMAFENVGVLPAYERLRAVTARNAVTACGGLVLTSLVSSLLGLLALGAAWLVVELELATVSPLVWAAIAAPAWLLSMYLEQMFVTGLYLYAEVPDSPVVSILLARVIGRELPERSLSDGAFGLSRL